MTPLGWLGRKTSTQTNKQTKPMRSFLVSANDSMVVHHENTHIKSHFDPLFKTWFTRIYIIFLILLVEAVRTHTHNLCFEQKYEKCQNVLFENFPFLVVKFSIYLNRHVSVICSVGSSLCVALWPLAAFFFISCLLSYCCVSWILSSTVIILLGKRELAPRL